LLQRRTARREIAMQRRVVALDGIRGVCVLPIVYMHAARGTSLGPLALEVFFVLSGFLIGGILLDTVGTPGWARRFYLRRTLRVWPLYYLAVAILLLTDPFVQRHSGLNPWLVATFLANIAAIVSPHHERWGAILWSTAVEEHFYLLLPPIVALMKRRFLPVALLLLAASSIVCRHDLARTQSNEFCYAFTFCRLDGLGRGGLTPWMARGRPPGARLAPTVALVAGCLEAYTLSQGPLWERAVGTGATRSIAWMDVAIWQTMSTFAAGALILALDTGRLDLLGRALSVRPLRLLGRISYGMYIFHGMAIEIMNTHVHWPPLVRFGVVMITTLPVAAASWHWFERPLLSLAPSSILDANSWARCSQ
jgi:peptidoglycan/LPS O-acetylase OafA/YrhL